MARAAVRLQLRWGDQDAYGHVNNVAYARLLEEARVRIFWLGTGEQRTGMEGYFRADKPGGPKMLVAGQHIEFLSVLEYYGQCVTVELWIGKLGGSSLEVHYEIVDEATEERSVVARAITTVVVVDGTTLRPQRIGPEGRELVAPWRDEPLRLGR